jgi:hypothetical protein
MTTPDLVEPLPGTVLHLDDPQYRFGTGPIICRVLAVLGLLNLDDGPPWWHVRAECALGTPSHHGPWHDRELYVAGTAVRRAPPRHR